MNPEYKHTVFLATRPPEGFPIRFGIVTACNPHGIVTDETRNTAALQELRKQLEKADKSFFSIIGCSPDLAHREPGYGFASQTAEEALVLGRIFKQEAIFWVEDGIVHLLPCRDGVRSILGKWNPLVLCREQTDGNALHKRIRAHFYEFTLLRMRGRN